MEKAQCPPYRFIEEDVPPLESNENSPAYPKLQNEASSCHPSDRGIKEIDEGGDSPPALFEDFKEGTTVVRVSCPLATPLSSLLSCLLCQPAWPPCSAEEDRERIWG